MLILSVAQLQALLPEFQHHLLHSIVLEVKGHRDIILTCAQPERIWNWHLLLDQGQSVCFLDEQPVRRHLAPHSWHKWLKRSQIIDLEQIQKDRLLQVRCQAPDGSNYALIVELTGRHGNLFLLDGFQRVLRLMKPDHSQRGLTCGDVYQPPPFQFHPKAHQDPLNLLHFSPDGSRSQQIIQQWQQGEYRQQWHSICQQLNKGQQCLQRRVQQLENQLEQAQQHETYQRWSELLPSAFGRVKNAATQVHVPDYYHPEAPLIEIPLQPHLDLGANIQRYAHQAHRYALAIPRIEGQLLQAWEQQQIMAQAQNDICLWQEDSVANLEKAQQCVVQLKQQGLLIAESTTQNSTRVATRLPYRVYTSRVGQTIWVGRTARDNEKLTFQVARGNDYWLHVRDASGSHVVVRLNKNQALQPETLQDAALLAAHYSKLSTESAVAVLLTHIKHVKRLKGAAPGTVQVASSKCVWVEHVQQQWQDFLSQQEDESSLKF